MTATTRLEVQVAAQKAIATLDEIKAKAQGAESAFTKLQKATSGGFDRLEAALGKMSGQLGQIVAAMDKLVAANARVTGSTNKISEAERLRAKEIQAAWKMEDGVTQQRMRSNKQALDAKAREIKAEFKMLDDLARAKIKAEEASPRTPTRSSGFTTDPSRQEAIMRQAMAMEDNLKQTRIKAIDEVETRAQRKARSDRERAEMARAMWQEEQDRLKKVAVGTSTAKPVAPLRDTTGLMEGAIYQEQRQKYNTYYRQLQENAAARMQADMRSSGASSSSADRRYGMSLSASDRVAGLQGKVDASGYAQATAALQRYQSVLNNTAASKRDVLAATSAFKRELGQIPRVTQQAHAGISELSLGTSSLSRLLANTAVVVQGFMAAFAFREILQANITMQQVKLTLDAVAGSVRAGAEEFKFAQEIANKYGFSIGEVAKVYGRFLSASKQAGDNEDVTRATFERTAAALRVLGKTDADIEGVFRAFEQIKSKGTVMAEELRLQLGDRIPGAVSLMAKAVGVSNQQLVKMMENGQVSAKYLDAFSQQLLNSVGGYDMAAKAANTLQATLGRLNTAALEAAEKIGQNGFNSAVQRATQSIIEFLKSAEGDRMLKSLGETTKYVADAFVLLFKNADLVFKLLASFAAAKAVSSIISINVAVIGLVKNFGSLGAVMSGGGLAGLSAAAGPLAAIAGIVTAISLTMTDSMKSHRENMQQIAETSKEASEAIAAAYKKVAGNISAPLAAIDAEIDQVMARYSQARQEIASAKNDQVGVIAAANRRTPGVNYTDVTQIKEADLQRDYKEATERLERFTGTANEAEKALAGLAQRRAENAQYEIFMNSEKDILKAHELIGATKDVSEGIHLIDQAYDLIANKKPIPQSIIDSIARIRAAVDGASDAQKLLDSIKKDMEKRNTENTAQVVGKRRGEGEKDLYKSMMTGSEQMKKAATEAAKNGTSMIAAFEAVAPGMSEASKKTLAEFVTTGNAAKDSGDKIGASFDATLRNLTRISDKLISGRVDWENYYEEIKKGNSHFSDAQVKTLATISGANDAIKAGESAASELRAARGGIISGAEVTAGDVGKLIKAYEDASKARSALNDVQSRATAGMNAARSVGAEIEAQDVLNKALQTRGSIEAELNNVTAAAVEKRKQAIDLAKAEATGLNSVIDKVKEEQAIKNRTTAVTDMIISKGKELAQTKDPSRRKELSEQIDMMQGLNKEIIDQIRHEQELTRIQRDRQAAIALRSPFDSNVAIEQLSRQASNDNSALKNSGVNPTETARVVNLSDRQRSAQLAGVTDPEVAQAAYATEIANIDALAAKHAWAAEYTAEAYNNSAIKRLEAERDWVSGAELGMRQYMQSAGNASTRMATVVSNAFKGMEDAMVAFSTGGKFAFADLARSVIADMIRMQVQASITMPLMNAMKGMGLFSSFFGGEFTAPTFSNTGSNMGSANTWFSADGSMGTIGGASGGGASMIEWAKGGVASRSGLHAFAKGGAFTNSIHDSPTLFKFAQGSQFGVMGEAGPEAVVPLQRGPDGSLGIANYGGGGGAAPVIHTEISVTVEGSASSGNDEADERQAQRIAKAVDAQVRSTVVSELQRQMRGGGLLNRV